MDIKDLPATGEVVFGKLSDFMQPGAVRDAQIEREACAPHVPQGVSISFDPETNTVTIAPAK